MDSPRTLPPTALAEALTNLNNLNDEIHELLFAGEMGVENIPLPPVASTSSQVMDDLSQILVDLDGHHKEIQAKLFKHFHKKRAAFKLDEINQEVVNISKIFPQSKLQKIRELLHTFIDFPNRLEIVLRFLLNENNNCNDNTMASNESVKRPSDNSCDVTPKKIPKLSRQGAFIENAELEEELLLNRQEAFIKNAEFAEELEEELLRDFMFDVKSMKSYAKPESAPSSAETEILDEEDVKTLVAGINENHPAEPPTSSEVVSSDHERNAHNEPSTSKDKSRDCIDDKNDSFSLIDYLYDITNTSKKKIAEFCKNSYLPIDQMPSDFQLSLLIDVLLAAEDATNECTMSDAIQLPVDVPKPKTYIDSDVILVGGKSSSRNVLKPATFAPKKNWKSTHQKCETVVEATTPPSRCKCTKRKRTEVPGTSSTSRCDSIDLNSSLCTEPSSPSVVKDVDALAVPGKSAIETVPTSKEPKAKDTNPYLLKMLCQVFPAACPDYLEKIAAGKAHTDEDFNDLVTFVVELDGNYPKRPVREPDTSETKDVELDVIKEVLPDADPDFLQMMCDKYAGKSEEFRVAINDLMETGKYPTLKDYQRRQQLSAQQRQYTSDFSVENFVKLFPDPEKFFNDPARKAHTDNVSSHYAILFLRNHFSRLHLKTINEVYGKCKCSLVRSAVVMEKLLDDAKYLMKTRRREVPLPNITNIPLLQEIAFISHKNEILGHLKKLKENEQVLRLEVKDAGLMKTCGCCYDDEVMPNEVFTCTEGCEFCKACVVKSVEVLFGEGKLEYPCLADCRAKFSLQILQAVLSPKLFSKVAQKKALEEVQAAGIDDLEMCPFCDFATILAETDKVFKCLNPDCMKESCRLCKEPSHIPLRCDEIEKDEDVKARTFIENKMTEALLRKCWKCGLKFYKVEGCNKMTCSCGAHMCYICKQPVQDYKHFNGQGGDRYDLCPLYSDTNKLNADDVLKGAANAKIQIGAKELKFDPTANFPIPAAQPQTPGIGPYAQVDNVQAEVGANPYYNARYQAIANQNQIIVHHQVRAQRPHQDYRYHPHDRNGHY